MYYLLPFNFTRINNSEVLINEIGDFVVVSKGTIEELVYHKIDEHSDLFKSLVANFFVSESPVPPMLDIYAGRLHVKKLFLDDFTALHIFVLTLRCNQNCIYCQASSQQSNNNQYDMSSYTMEQSVKLMMQSPAKNITMEFQGGEPSLMPELLRYGIELSKQLNIIHKKHITYVLCTNCIDLTDQVLGICKMHNVLISTSLDGPASLHNINRGKSDSFQKVISGINKARLTLGTDRVSALMTTSEKALLFSHEIIDCYIANGFNSIFIRALNPYGLATKNEDWSIYNEKFISFYREALDYIIDINLSGKFFVEEFAAIVLRKMLTPYSSGFVDLQSPSGVINSVIVYNYDGYVYASDESRMLAEHNDYSFCLGKVSDPYDLIFYGNKAQSIASVWANETIAGCADCALMHYCGADPVRNYSTQKDMYGHRPSSLLCKKYKAIIEYLIQLMIEKKDIVLPIFKRWIQ